MSENRVTRVDLLRHGACEGGEIYRGSTDVPLSVEGESQMQSAATRVSDCSVLIASPLIRCRQFAKGLASQRGLPLLVDERFREMHFGEWEGRELKRVWKEDNERAMQFYTDPVNHTPPGGENVVDVQTRVVAGLQEQLATHSGENLLIVCHGGVIRLLLCHMLKMPLSVISRLHVPYGSLTRLQVYHRAEGDFPMLISLNALEGLE